MLAIRWRIMLTEVIDISVALRSQMPICSGSVGIRRMPAKLQADVQPGLYELTCLLPKPVEMDGASAPAARRRNMVHEQRGRRV